MTFSAYKSDICHKVKRMGDIAFIKEIHDTEEPVTLYNEGKYKEALYLLAMTDYLCRINNIEKSPIFDELRKLTFKDTIYPDDAVILDKIYGTNECKEKVLGSAIPEFLSFNIVEGDIRNVY